MDIQYPRKIMTRTELIELGIPEIVIDRAIKSQWAFEFAEKSGKGRTAKWLINTPRFEYWREQGAFQ